MTQGGFRHIAGYRSTFLLGMPERESPYSAICYIQRSYMVAGEKWDLVGVTRPIAIMLAAHASLRLPLSGRASRFSRTPRSEGKLEMGAPIPQMHPEHSDLFLPVIGISKVMDGRIALNHHVVLVTREKGPVGLLHFEDGHEVVTDFCHTDQLLIARIDL